MNADELKAVQAPFKQRYLEDPAAATITLRAQSRLGEGITCKVETGQSLVEAGLHPATGGSGASACSGDMLLEALAACAGVTLAAVATAIGVELRGPGLRLLRPALRGHLHGRRAHPPRLGFDLDCDATEEQLASLIKLTERYCVVYQTLKSSPPVAVSYTQA